MMLAPSALLFRTLTSRCQDRAIGTPASGTLVDCFCEQPFELPEIVDIERISPRCEQRSRGHPRMSASPALQSEQGADVFDQNQVPGRADEGEQAGLAGSIDTTAAFGTRGRP